MEFYASCPEGFESALVDELKRLGLSHVRRLKGRATFEGELEQGYRACCGRAWPAAYSWYSGALRRRMPTSCMTAFTTSPGKHRPSRLHHRHHRPRRD
ncbi:MAG: hypothetical protein ACLU37_01130 [Collinsella sp.]